MEAARHALESLNVKLTQSQKQGQFFLGKTPSSIDATLLGTDKIKTSIEISLQTSNAAAC